MEMEDDFLIQEPIEPGQYRMVYESHRRTDFRSQPKWEVDFRIQPNQPNAGRVVTRYYNLEQINEGSEKRYRAKRNSFFVRDYIRLFGDEIANPASMRLSRMNPIIFIDRVLLAEVSQVTRDSQRQEIPELIRPVKVSKLIRLEDVF